jgi:hypothetical protein
MTEIRGVAAFALRSSVSAAAAAALVPKNFLLEIPITVLRELVIVDLHRDFSVARHPSPIHPRGVVRRGDISLPVHRDDSASALQRARHIVVDGERCGVRLAGRASVFNKVFGQYTFPLHMRSPLPFRLRKLRLEAADAPRVDLSGPTRRERDLLGEGNIPVDALYGIQTLRAM